MTPEIGHFALILALVIAIVQAVVPMAGSLLGRTAWMSLARPLAFGQFAFMVISFGTLVDAFLRNDFTVAYVAHNGNTELPTLYKISAVWGAHEGSLLLWGLILAGWGFAVAVFSRQLPLTLIARVLSVMGFIAIGFLLFMLLTSNPFDRLLPMPQEGRDLNPLLQDFGLAIHPPMLYMGYVGFSVAFAFAIAALIGGRLDATWARWSRPWTTIAWAFLGTGIALGSWWAYYELGWGGWWFWDPVENASFMPWIVGTALLHSLAVTEKRGAFKRWTVLLAISAFSLSLLGTFLVRSGVLTSVHAFASDPERGVFILGFLGVVIGGSLTLYAWRAPGISVGGAFSAFSRETLLLANNVVLAVAAVTVLLGTLFPLIADAFYLGKVSVGFPYFNATFVPLMVPLFVLMGIGPLVGWRGGDVGEFARRARVAFAAAVIAGVVLSTPLIGAGSLAVGLAGALAVWIVATSANVLWARVRLRSGIIAGLRAQSPSFYGMLLAHIGVAFTIVGVAVVSQYGVERDVSVQPGDTTEVAGYRFVFDSVADVEGPNYTAQRGHVRVLDGKGRQVAVLDPEKRVYRVQTRPMTEAGIDAGFTRDLYVSLGEPLGGGAWSLRVYYKPFVRWIWLGALLMAAGGLLAVSDRRYRLVRRARAGAADGAVATRA